MEDKIIVGIIAAISAVFGVVFSNILALVRDYFVRKEKRNVLLRERFEELGEQITQATIIVARSSQCRSRQELDEYPINVPLRRAVSLTIIYFPEIMDAAIEFQENYISYYDFLVTSFDESVPYNAGTQAAKCHKNIFREKSMAIASSREKIDELIQKYATKYTKA